MKLANRRWHSVFRNDIQSFPTTSPDVVLLNSLEQYFLCCSALPTVKLRPTYLYPVSVYPFE